MRKSLLKEASLSPATVHMGGKYIRKEQLAICILFYFVFLLSVVVRCLKPLVMNPGDEPKTPQLIGQWKSSLTR